MNILIDGRSFTATSAGISNFLKDSVKAWAIQHPQDSFYIALPKTPHDTFCATGLPDNVKLKEHSNALFRRLPNLIWLLLMMPILSRRYKADIYFSPVPCLPFFLSKNVKKIIIVHDVVNIEYQKTMQWTNVLVNKLFFNRSIMIADIIWTNSLYTQNKVKQYFPKRHCQNIFTGASIDRHIYHPINMSEEERREIMQKYNIQHPFILFVGSLEPRKNLSFLLSLMPELWHRAKLQLVVVGGKGWKNSHIHNIVEDKDYPRDSTVFCGFVPNEDLVKLYHMAECFVSASLNEGFGMPQLEALSCGCPIITAHNSAMIEIAEGKDGAFTVKGYHQQDWIATIMQVVKQQPKVNTAQLAPYDWDFILKNFIDSRL